MKIHNAGVTGPLPSISNEGAGKAAQSSSTQPQSQPESHGPTPESSEAHPARVRTNYPYSSVKTRLPPVASAGKALPEALSSLPGYLLLRRLDHRPVDQEGINSLIPADKAVTEARRALPFGRGNIDVDAQLTNQESRARTVAARRLRKDAEAAGHEPMPANAPMNWHVLVAMSGQVFGAGNCGEHAHIASFAYGALAQENGRPEDENIHLVASTEEDHVWAETDESRSGTSTIVMDPWSNGPAIFAEDSRFAKNRNAVERTDTFKLSTAAEAGNITREIAEKALTQATPRLQQRLADQQAHVLPIRSGRYRQEQSVLDDAFVRRVSGKLTTPDPQRALQVEMEAVGVAMSLGAKDVKDVKEVTRKARPLVELAEKVASPLGLSRRDV
ncbi:type III effector [Pseudomonas tremae]|uniref:type III effector n=1 Tax=Pseudomonas tremae TaxID=200454 RepID=UPI00210F0361|nr:type III effector [Pseudomonas tremae]MCQ2991018.1 type III effector [Pseudomonas tremae]